MPQLTLLKATGLYLTDNPLEAPVGSLSRADDSVIQRGGVVEARRGNEPDVLTTAFALTAYEGSTIAHTGSRLRRRTSPSTYTEYSGTYTAPAYTRMRFGEAKGNLYIMAAKGVYRLDDVEGEPASAGVPTALEGTFSLSGTSGYLPGQSSVAYRFVWGLRDGNDNILLGAPSGRLLASNGNTTSRDVTVTTRIPQGIVAGSHFLQIYRTEPMLYAETLGPPVAIVGGVRASNVTTLTTASIHRFTVGQTVDVQLAGSTTYPSGQKVVTATPSGVTFSYSDPGTDIAAGGGAGTVAIVTYAAADPGEEMAQVAEIFPTPADFTAGTISYVDVATFANGPTAYFSPSQGGIVNAKEQPPVARDMAMFKGHAFYAAVKGRQRLQMTLLAVGGARGLNIGDGITVARREGFGLVINQDYVGAGVENPAAGEFLIYTDGTPAQNIEATARSLVRVINATPGFTALMYATYASGANDPPGIIQVEAREMDSARIAVSGINKSNVWAPALRASFEVVSMERVSGVVTVEVASTNSFQVGDMLRLEARPEDPNFPNGLKTISAIPSGTTFEYAEAGPDATFDPSLGYILYTDVSETYTDNGVSTNTWALSSFEEPEAVPPSNYFTVGGETATLYRVIAQGDGLWFFASDGIYRLSGDTAENFTLRPFDLTVKLLSPDSVVALANRIFALTDQGVVAVSDTGVEVVSHIPGRTSIQRRLQELQAYFDTQGLGAAYRNLTHAVGYETEHEYRVWIPDGYTDAQLAVPSQAYVFNTQTASWTRHLVPARSAVINPAVDLLYVGGDTRLSRERKTRTVDDYQDAANVGIPFNIASMVQTAGNPGALKHWREVVVHLEPVVPTTVGLGLSTEVSPTPATGTLTTNGLTTVRTHVPVDKSYSTTLTVGVNHSTARERCSVLGLSILYNDAGTAVR